MIDRGLFERAGEGVGVGFKSLIIIVGTHSTVTSEMPVNFSMLMDATELQCNYNKERLVTVEIGWVN